MTTTPVRLAPLRDRVAEEIRVALARHRMSGAELARKLGVSQAYVWRRMNGDLPFALDDVERIAGVLGMEPVALIPGGGATRDSAAGGATVRYGRLTRMTSGPRGRVDITRPGDLLTAAA